MAEKGLAKPVKLKSDLASFLGVSTMPRTQIISKLWDYIKSNKLQTKTENGKAENAGKYIVVDDKMVAFVKNAADYKNVKAGNTIHMMKLAGVISANVEA
jgi:chromatin remodeling complex protein RSC6